MKEAGLTDWVSHAGGKKREREREKERKLHGHSRVVKRGS